MSEIEDTLAERDYGTNEDDLAAYARAGGAVGGAAACAAAGAAVLSPLCAEIGGWLGGAIFGALASLSGSREAAERAATEAQEAGWDQYVAAADLAAVTLWAGARAALADFAAQNQLDLATVTGAEPWASLPHGGALCDLDHAPGGTCFSSLACWRGQQFGPDANAWLSDCQAQIAETLEAYRRRVLAAVVETLANVAAAQPVPIALRVALLPTTIAAVATPEPEPDTGGSVALVALALGGAALLTRRRRR